jgi:hypothetical protein
VSDDGSLQPTVFIRSAEIEEEMELLNLPFAVLFSILIFIDAVRPELPEFSLMQAQRRSGFDEKAIPAASGVFTIGVNGNDTLDLHADGHIANSRLGLLAPFKQIDIITSDTLFTPINAIVTLFYGLGFIAEKVDYLLPFAIIAVIAVNPL